MNQANISLVVLDNEVDGCRISWLFGSCDARCKLQERHNLNGWMHTFESQKLDRNVLLRGNNFQWDVNIIQSWKKQAFLCARPSIAIGAIRVCFSLLSFHHMFSGEVSRSRRYCNAWPTRDRAGASSWTLSPYKNQFNIEDGTWPSYQILSW